MPLPPPAPRRHLHDRRIACYGYQREDGLWDIEGHITDTKTYPFETGLGSVHEAGEPVHDMWLRLTVDGDLVIKAIVAVTDRAPFSMCPDITENFQRLVGLRIGAGWNRAVKERLGGREGCTHLVELLGPVATVAFQTLGSGRDPDRRDPEARQLRRKTLSKRPYFLDGCHAWSSDGPNVARDFPQFYTGPKRVGAGD